MGREVSGQEAMERVANALVVSTVRGLARLPAEDRPAALDRLGITGQAARAKWLAAAERCGGKDADEIMQVLSRTMANA